VNNVKRVILYTEQNYIQVNKVTISICITKFLQINLHITVMNVNNVHLFVQ